MLARTIAWNRPLSQITAEMDRMFESTFPSSFTNTLTGALMGSAFPAVNAWEDADGVYVEAEVPGLSMDQIDLTVHGDELTIKGRRPAPDEGRQAGTPGPTVLRRERWTGTFERTLALPAPVEVENVKASLVNGVLAITLPKVPAARPRKIQIQDRARA